MRELQTFLMMVGILAIPAALGACGDDDDDDTDVVRASSSWSSTISPSGVRLECFQPSSTAIWCLEVEP